MRDFLGKFILSIRDLLSKIGWAIMSEDSQIADMRAFLHTMIAFGDKPDDAKEILMILPGGLEAKCHLKTCSCQREGI